MQCHGTFEAALDEVVSIAEHADKLLSEGGAAARALGNAIARSGLVLLCGYVEGYVRDLAEEAVDEINRLALSPDILPAGLFVSLLKNVVESPIHKREEKAEVLRQAFREHLSCELDRKRLSDTGGNPSVDTIESLFGVFGLGLVIDRLSIEHFGVDSTFVDESQASALRTDVLNVLSGDAVRADAVLALVDNKWRPRRKRRTVGYVSEIQELLKQRNRIAHGEGRETITPEELRGRVEHMRRLGEGLHGLLHPVVEQLRLAAAA
jgi:hypothetical protein